MRNLDKYEQQIVKELIKNPRCSDNQVSKNTKIPVKTVNRKRKKLEEEGLLYYFSYLDNGPRGTGLFSSIKLYCVKLRHGISQKMVTEDILSKESSDKYIIFNSKHVLVSLVGERDGHVTLILIIESFKESDINEIYNKEIVPMIISAFGNDSISSTEVVSISYPVRILHNYLLSVNMQNGIIRKDWPDKGVFVMENLPKEQKPTNK